MDKYLSLMKATAKQSADVLQTYLKKMFPCGGRHLRYENADELIHTVKKKALQKQMLYLLRKTSDSDNLSNTLGKLKKKYELSKKQAESVLAHFDKLDISPITMPNSSAIDKLPALAELLQLS